MGAVAAKRGQKGKKTVDAVSAGNIVEAGMKVDEQNQSGMVTTGTCSNGGDTGRCRRRQFSEQAWTVLLLWNEINPAAVDRPICTDCYEEMREILIDRTDEVEAAMQQSEEVAKIREKLGNLAS